jgi:hypothetical protein
VIDCRPFDHTVFDWLLPACLPVIKLIHVLDTLAGIGEGADIIVRAGTSVVY